MNLPQSAGGERSLSLSLAVRLDLPYFLVNELKTQELLIDDELFK
jgi:hypothetical protein